MSSAAISLPSRIRFGDFQQRAWLGVAVIAMIDAIWAGAIGLRVTMKPSDFEMLAILTALFVALRSFGWKRSAMTTEFLALSVAISVVFTIFCYLALASSGALVDKQLLAIDRAMGFDWLSDYKFVMAHPPLARTFRWLYISLNFQVLYLCVLLAMMEREENLREMFWLIFTAAIVTNALAIALPAYGPFEIFGLQSRGAFLPDMKHLKSGRDLTFALSQMTGVISFPSFHTVMALSYAWCLRRTGIVGYLVAAANGIMILGIPFFGGHYLIDVIAGAGVTLLSLGIVKAVAARRQLFGLLNHRLALG